MFALAGDVEAVRFLVENGAGNVRDTMNTFRSNMEKKGGIIIGLK